MHERTHPYDLVFGAGEFESRIFPSIRDEAQERGVDVWDRGALLQLVTVGELLRSLLPPDSGATAFEQFSSVVVHAFHFWLSDKHTYTIDDATLRTLLSAETHVGAWDMAPPFPAGYVQLPRNLLFARIDEGVAAEAVDGFFFTMPGLNDPAVPPFVELQVLLVLGLMPHREGFSIIDIVTPFPAELPGHFGDAQAREEGSDFANVLPGGERLFALTNRLEALKLVSRCFWQLR